MSDPVIPLCTAAQFTEGAFADLVSDYPPTALTNALAEATRRCEGIANRKLAPFTITETHRARGADPDEYAGSGDIPMDIQSTLSMSFASAMGSSLGALVRHFWLNEYPPHHPDLWVWGGMSPLVIRSYGGNELLTGSRILDGPDNLGHVWVQLGTFIPIGSRVRFTYGGGYSPYPGDLVRAGKYMTASIVIRELNPDDVQHNPDQMEAQAEKWLKPYIRGGAGRK